MRADSFIFIVDDDEAVRDSLGILLEAHGHCVHDFASAAEFLESGVHTIPGCLVLDHHMPEMTGLDLLEELRRLGFCCPTILITGLIDRAIRQRAVSAGVVAILEKPLARNVLIEAVNDALHRAEA